MPKRYKERLDFMPGLMEAARARVNDTHTPIESASVVDQMALDYLRLRGSTPPDGSILGSFFVLSESNTNLFKDFKFAVHSMNAKINTTTNFVRLNTKDIFSTLYEIQRQVYKLDSEVGEAEIKMINGFSKVHLNTFARQMDSQIGYGDKSWLTDFKSSFTYPEKYLMHLLPSSGITLPRRHEIKIPIVDAYIVDEQTDVGDTLTPVISTSPRNVFIENKIFKHIILRKGFDETSRKYKSKTIYDNYPYSATSQLSIELVLPNICMINYLKVNPVNGSVFSIKDISYLNEAGEQVSIVSQKIDSDLFATYLFEPIHTKFLRVTFEQTSAVTKTSSLIGDLEREALNEVLEGAGYSLELDSKVKEISGRWYDFSIKDIEVGEIAYENKGIYRSKAIKVSSPLGAEVTRFVEAITPEELFSEYYKTVSLPEGKALSEAYLGVRLNNAQQGTTVDSIVPIWDSYPTQIEFLDFLDTDARVKLFPDLEWHLEDNCVKKVVQEEVCITLDELVPEEEVTPIIPPAIVTPEGSGSTPPEATFGDLTPSGTLPSGTGSTESSCLLGSESIIVDEEGSKRLISEIQVGDYVYTYDYREKTYGDYAVTGVMSGTSSGWIEMFFENVDRPIKCSPSHHMLDEDFNQIPASLMEEGHYTWMITDSGSLKCVMVEDVIYHDDEVDVYNIEVEDAHTYITENRILQHNKTYTTPGINTTIIPEGRVGVTEQEDSIRANSSSGIENTTSWTKRYTNPDGPTSITSNKTASISATNAGLESLLGSAYSDLSEDDKAILQSNSTSINNSLGLSSKLRIGTDGRYSGYTKTNPTITNKSSLNFVDSSYWNTKLAQVTPTLTGNNLGQQTYSVSISSPPKNLSKKQLTNLSNIDRLEVKRVSKIQELATDLRTMIAPRSSGLDLVLASLSKQETLDTLNSFVNSVMSPRVGYRVNSRGALELGIIDSDSRVSSLYSKEFAAIKRNEDYKLKNQYLSWKTITSSQLSGLQAKYSTTTVNSNLNVNAGGVASPSGGINLGAGYPNYSAQGGYVGSELSAALEEVSDCVEYLCFTTEAPHLLSAGSLVTLSSVDEVIGGVYVVGYVADEFTFCITKDSFDDVTKADLKNSKICMWILEADDPIELYEDDRLLTIGVDYSISLDDKSTWYDYFVMPGEASYSYLNKRAKAGRFYVRVYNRRSDAVYWIKYRVKRNQFLSSCNKIMLKNGRVVFDKSLRKTFGTLQTIFVFRTNSTNPYITPILREYSLRIQEKESMGISKSNSVEKEVHTRDIGSKRNVS